MPRSRVLYCPGKHSERHHAEVAYFIDPRYGHRPDGERQCTDRSKRDHQRGRGRIASNKGHDAGTSRSQIRLAGLEEGSGRRSADFQLGIPGLHRVLRVRPGDSRGPETLTAPPPPIPSPGHRPGVLVTGHSISKGGGLRGRFFSSWLAALRFTSSKNIPGSPPRQDRDRDRPVGARPGARSREAVGRTTTIDRDVSWAECRVFVRASCGALRSRTPEQAEDDASETGRRARLSENKHPV